MPSHAAMTKTSKILLSTISTVLLLLSTYPTSTSAQVLLSNTLPSCAQGCAQLQNAQSSCTPAGGAPVSNDATYKSCFCQSALLSQLYSPQPVQQFCTQCSQGDMATIQSWYKGFCASGAMPSGGNPSSAAGAPGATGSAGPATSVVQSPATTKSIPLSEPSTTVTNTQDLGGDDSQKGPWSVDPSVFPSSLLCPFSFD